MATNNFGERMRERMPSHHVWRDDGTAPAVSRTVDQALWDDMRERLRAYERERKRLDRQVTLHHVHVRIRQSDRRSVAVVMFACGMVAVAAYQILR